MSDDYTTRSGHPRVFVSGVAARDRSGWGVDWGPGDRRNSGGRAEGPQAKVFAVLTGIKRALLTADSYGVSHIVIVINVEYLVPLIRKRARNIGGVIESLLNRIYNSPVKFTIEYRDVKSDVFERSLKIARKTCGTHSEARNPIDDNLFDDGVLRVSVYGASEFDRNEKFKKGAAGVFFENDSKMNLGERVTGVSRNYECQMEALAKALNIALIYQFREIRVRTRSRNIYKLITFYNKHGTLRNSFGRATSSQITRLTDLMDSFENIFVDPSTRMENDYGVKQAEKLAKEVLSKSEMYWEDDIPVVYTDGACPHNGKNGARAGAGVFWGPGDSRNARYPVSGQQTNNRAEYTAVLRAIEIAQLNGIKRLIIRTDSDLMCKSINTYIKKWKTNGWIKSNGEPVKNQDLLKAIDWAMGQLESVSVQKVAGHSSHEGNDGADALAREAAEG